MIDHLLRDLQVLRKADMLVGKIWLNVLARRLGLLAFAALIAVFGLGMANVAGYNALQNSLGTVWAATVLALVDFTIAAIVLLIALRSHPGPEIDVALEVRKTALESLHEDARDIKLTIDVLGQEIRNVKQSVTALVHNPLDVAAEKLLVPAALSVLRGLRSKKEHS
ncbi:phage holin family protein [Bradyrhizobium embrapense]|uniref:phage holin family protein n=1 Tax=Bradyrhizobium embrapense TaxID=630921 RepID=UPI00067AB37A|nr:phage holin family protein [Bradyrhizobium embrapense]